MHTDLQTATEIIKGLKPVYDINKTYAENIKEGPCFEGELPRRIWPDESRWIDFLGYRIASPLGVPSGPLLSSRWTTLAARLGFDVIAYKTIRSQGYLGHPLPNVIFVDPNPVDAGTVKPLGHIPHSMNELSITNSFGNPSMPPVFLLEDIARARASLAKGQVLIVSVFGSTDFSQEVKEDFVRTAQLAKEAGAHIIEANFSCPNVSSKEGCLYMDADSSYEIASAIAKAVAPLPLLIKLGRFHDAASLRRTLTSLARAGAHGICGINTISKRIVNTDGSPALGANRETGGVCGSMIRQEALNFVREARAAIDKERLGLELAACGGIVEPGHFDDFLNAGAKIAMTATGMMWNPYIATQWHQQKSRCKL